MARDPAIAHTVDELRNGLWLVAAGYDHWLNEPLRAELLSLGLVRPAADGDQIFPTPEGRSFLND
jgi:hypothetical protein